MKKMMIIAAMVSMMLIPAQMEAKNKVNNKAKVEYRNDKKDFGKKDDKKFKNDKKDKKNKKNKKKDEKPQAMIKMPAPRPAPLPQAQIKVVKEVNPVNAVASAIGLVALAAIIAN